MLKICKSSRTLALVGALIEMHVVVCSLRYLDKIEVIYVHRSK